jgi:hypothetical protein
LSARSDVLLWAHRTIARKGSAPHVLLEVNEAATPDQVQEAFHKIARASHPDLHRNTLSADELELVTRAYSAVACAYTVMRSVTTQARTAAGPEPRGSEPRMTTPPVVSRTATATPPAGARTVQPPPLDLELVDVPAEPPADPASAMSPKALPYYRKAETCLKRGDFRGAILQLKLAVNTDPSSAFLRTALAHAEAQSRKTP